MTKNIPLPLTPRELETVTTQLNSSFILFDVKSGFSLIPYDKNIVRKIGWVLRLSRRIAHGQKDHFEVHYNSREGFWVNADASMRSVLASEKMLVGFHSIPVRKINPEAALFIEKMQVALKLSYRLRTGLDEKTAIDMCRDLNAIIKDYRLVTRSADWKKMIRSHYRKIRNNYDSVREYLLKLTKRHRSLELVWFDFVFQQARRHYLMFPIPDVSCNQIEQARRKIIRYMKSHAPGKSFVGFVWQVTTSRHQGSRLSVLAFYKSGFRAELEDYKHMVKDYWKSTAVPTGQGFCHIGSGLTNSISGISSLNKEAARISIGEIATSMTKTQIFVQPDIDRGKTVGHGQIS